MFAEDLIHEVHRKMLTHSTDPKLLLQKLETMQIPNQDEWFKVIKK